MLMLHRCSYSSQRGMSSKIIRERTRGGGTPALRPSFNWGRLVVGASSATAYFMALQGTAQTLLCEASALGDGRHGCFGTVCFWWCSGHTSSSLSPVHDFPAWRKNISMSDCSHSCAGMMLAGFPGHFLRLRGGRGA